MSYALVSFFSSIWSSVWHSVILVVVGRDGVTMFLAKNVFCCDCAVSVFYLYVENTVNRLIHYYCQEPEDEACSVHSRIIMLYFSACEFLTNNTPSTSRMPSFECIRKKNFWRKHTTAEHPIHLCRLWIIQLWIVKARGAVQSLMVFWLWGSLISDCRASSLSPPSTTR